MGLLNPGGPIAQLWRNLCSIPPVVVISESGIRIQFFNTGKSYLSYIRKHPDETYVVTGYYTEFQSSGYLLSGEMCNTFWTPDELILVSRAEN